MKIRTTRRQHPVMSSLAFGGYTRKSTARLSLSLSLSLSISISRKENGRAVKTVTLGWIEKPRSPLLDTEYVSIYAARSRRSHTCAPTSILLYKQSVPAAPEEKRLTFCHPAEKSGSGGVYTVLSLSLSSLESITRKIPI